jgi:hypothetical protein
VTAILTVMILIIVVALVVISVFLGDEDDWTTNRPGRRDPDEGSLDDLLG